MNPFAYVAPELMPVFDRAVQKAEALEVDPTFTWSLFRESLEHDPNSRHPASPQFFAKALIGRGLTPKDAFIQCYLESHLGDCDFSGEGKPEVPSVGIG